MQYHIDEVFIEGEELGYTDFVKIYLNKKVTGNELDVLRLHECSHIWLRHNVRRKNIINVNPSIWNIACDMEIALHIYDQKDEDIIVAPRSRLKGGIIKKHCEKYNNCIYAEDFYESLLKEKSPISICWDDMKEDNSSISKSVENFSIQDCIMVAKKEKQKQEIKKSIQKQQHTIKQFSAPKPSLASEIDSIRRQRSLLIREKTFARPSRREHSDFIKKGKRSKLKSANITVYIDRSGSFSIEKTREANERLRSVLKKYRGTIKLDCLYFNDRLLSIDPIHGGGGTNYADVVHHINSSSSSLNIIITDNDHCDSNLSSKEKIVIIPIGCSSTNVGMVLNAKDVL